MAPVVVATQPPELEQDWNINKSSFVPPVNHQIVRAWDRAKVPSHTPRLRGKKVWKKLARPIEKDGKLEEAQLELQKDSSGSRKKQKAANAKQNIRDAEWDGTEWEGFPDEITTTATIPALGQEDSLPDDLQLVSRKRRNNNKIVSPRKPLRQTTLNGQAQPEAFETSLEDAIKRAARPRKSLSKSLRKSMLPGIENAEIAPETETSRSTPIFNAAMEPTQPHVFSPLMHTPLKSPGKKNRSRKGTRRSSAGEPLRLSGAFFADATIDAVVPSDEPATAITDSLGTPVRSTAVSEIPATAPPKIRLSKSELEQQMVNFFTPIPRMKKIKRRSSPIKSYLQELLEKKSQPLESTEQDAKGHWTLGENQDSSDADEIESNRELSAKTSSAEILYTTSDPEKMDLDDETLNANHAQESSSPLREKGANLMATTLSPRVEKSSSEEEETALSTLQATEVSEEESSTSGHHSPINAVEPIFEHTKNPIYEHTEEASNSDSTSSETSESADSHKSTESTSSNPSTASYDHDDTDMLRSFLTRVKASKAKKESPKRDRPLPHSPLRIPLGEVDSNLSPSPLKPASKEDTDPTASSPIKRSKRLNPGLESAEESAEPQSCRRSGRTRLPVKSIVAPPGAPSFIPVRRLGQDADTTVTLKVTKSAEKELSALTRVNTRKNKAGAIGAAELLAKKGDENDDPVLRQRLLKEVFDEKESRKGKKKSKKSVVWAEELTSIREFDEKKIVGKGPIGKEKGNGGKKDGKAEKEGAKEKEKSAPSLKVGTASTRESKIALGMAVNGTPVPKRRMREPRVKVKA